MLNVSCNSHCFLALCCALHRITSRVIHRTELFYLFYMYICDSYSMTNNNDLLNGKVYKQDNNNRKSKRIFDVMTRLFYIMVRHNHHIHMNIRLCEVKILFMIESNEINQINGNDPYAGSPTNTLLRLLLPLNDPVWASFRYKPNDSRAARKTKPKISLKHSIGSSDGRCVQRTGT
jgi:hypothetical protein